MQTRIYTWNPVWSTFQHFSLRDKIQQFKVFVEKTQETFLQTAAPDEICFIVAPDEIFSPAGSNNYFNYTYAYTDKKCFEYEMHELHKKLNKQICVIAGTIDYSTENQQNYKIRAFIITAQNGVEKYDKKCSTEEKRNTCIVNETENHTTKPVVLSMCRGTAKNVFIFQGLKIGIEICQDHEEATLVNQRQNTDIHFLLSAGQTRRHPSINVAPLKKGCFVQVERMPRADSLMNVDCRTLVANCERVRHVNAQSQKLSNHAYNCADFYRYYTELNIVELQPQIIDQSTSCYTIETQPIQKPKFARPPCVAGQQKLFKPHVQEVAMENVIQDSLDKEKKTEEHQLVQNKRSSCIIQ